MDTKAAFERFLQRKGISCEHWDATDESYGYVSEEADALLEVWLESWTASRAAIEIELPQRQSLCASGYGDGYFVPSSTGEGLEYDEVVEAITSHGIRIKGKTE